MARKRGGLAGLYDRNKGAFKALVPMALGAIPGVGMPLAAIAGAAMGADREGKSYFKGFDVGGALKGGLSGYGAGAAGAGVRGLLTGGKAGAAQALGEYNRPVSNLLGKAGGAGSATQAPPTSAVDAVTRSGAGFSGMSSTPMAAGAPPGSESMLSRAGDIARSGLSFARENKDLIGMAGKGLMAAMPDPGTEAAMMNAETGRMRFEQEKADAERERERSRRIAELLMPYLEQQGYLGSTR